MDKFAIIIVTVIVGVIFYYLIVSLVNILSGKLLGGKLLEYKFYFVRFSVVSGKREIARQKFSFCPNSVMDYGDKYGMDIKLKQNFLNAIFLSIFAIVFSFFGYGVTDVTSLGYKVFNSFVQFSIVAALITIFLSIHYFILSKSNTIKGFVFRNNFLVMDQFRRGVLPKDVEVLNSDISRTLTLKSESANIYVLWQFYHFLDKGYVQELYKAIPLFKSKTKVYNPMSMPYFYDYIFLLSITPDNQAHAQAMQLFKSIQTSIIKDMDVNGRRVLAYYQYYVMKDVQGAYITAQQGLDTADKYYISGIGKMEKKLLLDLLRVMDEQKNNQQFSY